MAALADLQPDRRAVLQLLVGRGRGYDQIAELLSLPEIVVRRRAHDAITTLAGGASGVTDPQRALLCDYLVGELPASRRAEARKLLADDAAARRFARTAAARLSAIDGAQLPELPPEDEEVAEALDALDARRERKEELETSSRRGAWLLVAGIAAAVVAAVVLLAVFAGRDDSDTPSTSTTTADTSTKPTSTQPTLVAELNSPSGGAASGQAALKPNSDGATELAVTAKGLASTKRLAGGGFTAYAFWLDGPDVDPLRLGFYDAQDSADGTAATDGTLRLGVVLNGQGVAPVDANDLQKYDTIFITREILQSVNSRPSTPGNIVLTGKLSNFG